MAAGKKKSSAAIAEGSSLTALAGDGAADQFVGRWNRLVSTTNWEKGRIICEWREALIADGAAVTEYSDEAWSQLVGRVTSQHVGRLRRVFQRFGDAFDQYQGLYWSHFQAAIDWEDAEMWLEGAIHNGWSVSQMRGQRWETVGKPGETMPNDDAEAAAGDDEDAPWLGEDESEMAAREGAVTGESAEVKSVEGAAKRTKEEADDEEGEEAESHSGGSSSSYDDEAPQSPKKSRGRLSVEVGDLPDDIADAFEQFKLAIITQRRLEWAETTPESVLECLDALRELTLAPLDA
ncbi:hypothetical protein [Lacipirellula limnantheis]|uniref:Uncharacterized protein n=1 Tax=Lacipirellula limnantheis TaxID=2528024 RepID=A0A517U686_9BACT|nr:hypothetical protein [Lacipirellula limnantheis]QDT76142.1 hypothetical protein I41_53870 [Lacipirellula limnantheis]